MADLTLTVEGEPVPVILGESVEAAAQQVALAAAQVELAAEANAAHLLATGALTDEAESAAAAALAQMTTFATKAAGVAATAVGEVFASAEDGPLTWYRHIAGAPFFEDIGTVGGRDAELRIEIADGDGSGISVQIPETGTSKRALNAVLGAIRVSIEDFPGAAPDWNGTTGTDNSPAIALAVATGAREIFVPPKPFKITDPILLGSGQQLIGTASALYMPNVSSNRQSLLAFRPAVHGKAAIKNAVGTNGQGVRGITLDCASSLDNGIQWSASYGNTIDEVTFWGTFAWCMALDDTYVIEINRCVTNCTVEKGRLWIGASNDVTVRRLHSGGLPNSAGVKTWTICVAGQASKLDLDFVSQGDTVGLEIGGSASNIDVRSYFENTVCNVIVGTASGGPTGVTFRGGSFGEPYGSHTQYASRGPQVWLRGGRSIHFTAPSLEVTPVPAGANGPWGFVLGDQLINVSIASPRIFGETDLGKLLMREVAVVSACYLMNGIPDYAGGHFAEETFRRVDNGFGGQGYRYIHDSSGDVVKTAYQPAVIPASVPALLSGAMPAAGAVLL